ncbi:MAG TPA: acyltransferase, partial [Myxococcales bacterium]|nr:acyltransferase [Myxococcales bacterium]
CDVGPVQESREGKPGRLREFDGWRAVAVLLVTIGHLGTYQREQRLAFIPRLAFMVRGFDPAGVAMLLVLSGFCICRLLMEEERRRGVVSLRALYWRGACRILPMVYLYLAAIALLLRAGAIKDSWPGVATAAALLFDVHFLPNWFTSHTWFFAVEAHFYLVVSIAWILLPKPRRAFGLLGLVCAVAIWNLIAICIATSSKMLIEMRWGFVWAGFGAMLALHEQKMRSIGSRVPGWLAAALFLMLLSRPFTHEGVAFGFYQTLVVPFAISLVLLFSLERGKWLRVLLCSKPVQALGLTAYGSFLWQQLFTAAPFNFAGSWQFIPRLLPMMLLIVPLSYFFIEQPARRLGRVLSNQS